MSYKVARETNEELRAINADPAEGFDVGAILSIARRCNFCNLGLKIGLKCYTNSLHLWVHIGFLLSRTI